MGGEGKVRMAKKKDRVYYGINEKGEKSLLFHRQTALWEGLKRGSWGEGNAF